MKNHEVDENGRGQASEVCSLMTPATQNLRRVVDDIPNRLWVVAFIGFWERFTFWGITAPWQNYMQNAPNENGVLGLGQSTATNIYCAFYIFYYFSPLIFGVISDTRLGRYNTLCLSIALYFVGCVTLCVSSHSAMSQDWGLPGLALSMFFIGFGGGGFKAIMAPFIADQYIWDGPTVKTMQSGEQVVTSWTETLQYIYNLYYWVGNLGSLSWFATVYLEHRVSFTAAYILATGPLLIAMILLFAGRSWFVKPPCEGNILPKATKVLLCASKNKFKMHRVDPLYQLEHHGNAVHWTSELVDELTRGLMACRVLIGFIAFYVCFDQMQNNLISQAGQMQSNDIPNDIMPAFNQVACIILGPVIQNFLYPFLQKRNIHFRPIARITVGFILTAAAMGYSALVQNLIYTTGPCYDHASDCHDAYGKPTTNHVNIWIQIPVYIFIAGGEIFAYVTALEYAYDHAPKHMKVIVQAISLVVAGLGSACAMALTPAAKDPHLVILYVSLAGVMLVTTGLFWWIFRAYDNLGWDTNSGNQGPQAAGMGKSEMSFEPTDEISVVRESAVSRQSMQHNQDEGKGSDNIRRPASDATFVDKLTSGVDSEKDVRSRTAKSAKTPDASAEAGPTDSFKSAKSAIASNSPYETANTRNRVDAPPSSPRRSTQPRPWSDATTVRPFSNATLGGGPGEEDLEEVDI